VSAGQHAPAPARLAAFGPHPLRIGGLRAVAEWENEGGSSRVSFQLARRSSLTPPPLQGGGIRVVASLHVVPVARQAGRPTVICLTGKLETISISFFVDDEHLLDGAPP